MRDNMNKKFFSDCQQRLNDFICEWQKLIAKNKNFLIYGIIWCIISFGFELFQYTESIDDEVFQLPNSFKFWAIQGRFTYGYVLQCFFGSLSVPFFALFFSQLWKTGGQRNSALYCNAAFYLCSNTFLWICI